MVNKKTSPKGKTVRVTFELPAEVAADSVAVVGDFNEWNPEKHPMTFNKKKGFIKHFIETRLIFSEAIITLELVVFLAKPVTQY